MAGWTHERLEVGALNSRWQGAGRDGRPLGRRTERNSVHTLVSGDSREHLHEPAVVPGPDQVVNGFLDGAGDEASADVEVSDKLAHSQVVDERQHSVRESSEHQEQGNDEAKR